ncbi:MAG: single-stranded-DNA-specific exonuclease RecJ [Verrucomicrobiales bacterium]|nr:single-stranded-DNA-specific exonuclease RecJ [Verrucomicrobiales bacterium]
MKWVLNPKPDPALVKALSTEFGVAESVTALAIQRGFDSRESLSHFFYPRLKDISDPFSLPGMQAAVDRVLQAVQKKEKIALYGDYDVDGVTSIALLNHILSQYGLPLTRFLPARLEEGYGLSREGIERAIMDGDPSLLIAADCGTNSRDEAEMLRKLGVDLIVLDHHEPSPDGIADCVSVVNPKLGDDFHYLCTAGVVFKFGHALLKQCPVPGFDLRDYLDLVALGTVADIVPLVDENRIFVRRGLQQLDRSIHPGLQALKEIAAVTSPVRASDVGFKLGPRLNAAGRLDTAMASLELVLSNDYSQAEFFASELDNRNRERQSLEHQTRDEAEAMIEAMDSSLRTSGIVVGQQGWHPGVVGIVASRISKMYHRPTFVIAFDDDGLGKGSGRSVEGVSLVEALESCRELIEDGGGHDMAAGVSLRMENLEAFQAAFAKHIESVANSDTLTPKLHIDAETTLNDLTIELLESYELLRPFGSNNPQPLFLCRGVDLAIEPRLIRERHQKFRLMQNGVHREAIYFNSAHIDLPKPPWDVAFTIDRNEFRGLVGISIVIQGIRKSTA